MNLLNKDYHRYFLIVSYFSGSMVWNKKIMQIFVSAYYFFKMQTKMNQHATPKKIASYNQHELLTLRETVSNQWELIVKNVKRNKSRVANLAIEFSQLIELNFAEHHSAAFYASKLNITESYLRKICQQVIGQSPTQCIQTRLMLEACIRLNSKNVTATEVAFDLNFNDYSYFSRFFKKKGGLPPDNYRKFVLK